MEVTRSTFSSALPEMLEAISGATFISFDGEFTGLSTGGSTITALDSPKMRYHKLKHNQAVDFLLLQVKLERSPIFTFFWLYSGSYTVSSNAVINVNLTSS